MEPTPYWINIPLEYLIHEPYSLFPVFIRFATIYFLANLNKNKIVYEDYSKAGKLKPDTQTITFDFDENYNFLTIYGTAAGYIKIPKQYFDDDFTDRYLHFDNGYNTDGDTKISKNSNKISISNTSHSSDSSNIWIHLIEYIN